MHDPFYDTGDVCRWQKFHIHNAPCRSALHVFLGATENASAVETRTLATDEHMRAARLQRPVLRKAFLASHILLRRALAWCTGAAAGELRIVTDKRGKPRLETPYDALHFNLSHSGFFTLIAASWCGPIGVDIEMAVPIPPLEIIPLVFTNGERAALDQTSEPGDAFFTGWTRKEAALKCIGLGLSRDPKSVEVSLDPMCSDSLATLKPADGAQRHIRLIQPPPINGAFAAVATSSIVGAIRFWRF